MNTTTELSINHEQRLYVMKSGNGFSCLGFDVCTKRYVDYCGWLGEAPQTFEAGTREAFEAYSGALARVVERCNRLRVRCNVELTAELVGLEGKRVCVTYPDGGSKRFWVGKSTGAIPIHLEIARRNSSGGAGVYFPKGSKVRTL